MDISVKIRELQEEIEKISSAEKQTRSRINELKSLLMEKKKRQDSLDALQKEEAELLAQLEA